ncbi:MAG: glycerol-3-phosphate acyltransferase, partial [Acutalibacter sp.]|nr:glycerol-3-phosphate acyltransferase [Acutalibacter sp.]
MLACAVIGYLLGSVNTAIIVTRLFKQKADIRNYGSGNAGMTN